MSQQENTYSEMMIQFEKINARLERMEGSIAAIEAYIDTQITEKYRGIDNSKPWVEPHTVKPFTDYAYACSTPLKETV